MKQHHLARAVRRCTRCDRCPDDTGVTPPTVSFDVDLDDPVRAREQYENQVKKRVADTKNAARSRGFTARNAAGVEPTLLDWLVANGELTFEEHRCEWRT